MLLFMRKKPGNQFAYFFWMHEVTGEIADDPNARFVIRDGKLFRETIHNVLSVCPAHLLERRASKTNNFYVIKSSIGLALRLPAEAQIHKSGNELIPMRFVENICAKENKNDCSHRKRRAGIQPHPRG